MAVEFDTLRLERFNGSELFGLETATLSVVQFDDGYQLVFAFRSCEIIQRASSLEEVSQDVRPKGEVQINVPGRFALGEIVNRTFSVSRSNDQNFDEDASHFYYYEHDGLDDNLITIGEMKGEQFLVSWIATTPDPNFYDGSKPKTKVEVKGWFHWGGITRQHGNLFGEEGE